MSAGYYLAGYANPATRTTFVGARVFEVEDGVTNDQTTIVTLRHVTTGTAVDGIGSRLLFQAEDAGGTTTQNAGAIDAILTTAAAGSEVGAIVIYGVTSGALAERARFGGAESIINDTRADVDFRVKTVGNTGMIFVDASGNNIGLGGPPTAGYLAHVNQPVSTSGSPSAFVVTGGAHTTLAANTEAVDIHFDLGRTVEFAVIANGPLTNQRAMLIEAPTYAFADTQTITNAATVYIEGAPAAGANATITNAYALWVDAGAVRLDGGITSTAATTAVLSNTSSGAAGALGPSLLTMQTTQAALVGTTIRNPGYIDFEGRFWETATGTSVAQRIGSYGMVVDTITAATGAPLTYRHVWTDRAGTIVASITEAGRVRVDDGTLAAPSYSFANATGTGMKRDPATGYLLLGMTGTYGLRVASTHLVSLMVHAFLDGSAVQPSIYSANQGSTGIYFPSANGMATATNGVLATQWNLHTIASAADATWDLFSVPAQTCTITGATGITTATGFNLVNIGIPTLSAASALTIDRASSLYLAGPPVGGGAGPATITAPYTLWIDDGDFRYDNAVALGGGVAPTVGTIGGSGPGVAAQNEWIRILTQNGVRFVPAWA